MTEPTLDRRMLLGAAALAGAAAAAPVASAQAPPAAGFAPQPQPLPFDPKAVPGLSEKLLISHHDNNYVGAVKRIAAIRAEFGKLDPATAQGFLLNGLKREELLAWNSMILHEVYFAGLAPATAPNAALAQAVERDFGSHARWAAEFSGMGKALGGGSGWVILAYSPHDRRLVNSWASDHTQTIAGAAPLMALDMYEHAYHMDYGAKAGAYVDAFMKAVSWGHANEAFRRATMA
jgi:superoxide dismutase, Fe-Mn family